MRRSLLIALLVIASTAFATPPGESFRRTARKAPALVVADDEGRTALALDSVSIRAVVRGHLARTIFELTYRNDLDHVVGGDFIFPLPADAEVSDLGLYFDGKLRHGVAVERAQARNAYEQIVHRRADPALAEWNAGRSFRLSIFPIPPHGTKSVYIAYDQELTERPYVLDLRWSTAVGRFDVTVDAETQRVEAEGLDLRRGATAWRAQTSKSKLDATITVTRNAADETALTAWSPEDGLWYASAPVRVGAGAPLLAPASRLVLLWDASGSGARRDDKAVLDFVRTLGASRITIIPFHIAVEPAQEIDAAALEPTIAGIPAAGATNLAAILQRIPSIAAQLPEDARLALVTDGISSLGDEASTTRAAAALASLRRPLMVINASASANDQLLGAVARSTGGWFLDLTSLTIERAAELARHAPARTTIESAWLPLRDVLPSAVITSAETAVTLNARSHNRMGELNAGIAGQRRLFTVRDAALPDGAADLVRRAWARARLRELVDAGASDAAILDHGRRFNQLTPRTSLLVLETWQDYETYGVPMPPDVRQQKEADEKEAAASHASLSSPSTIESRGRGTERAPDGAAWFIRGTVRDSGGDSLPGVTVTLIEGERRKSTVTEAQGRYWLTLDHRPASFRLEVMLSGFGNAVRTFDRGAESGTIVDVTLSAAVAETITVTAAAPATATNAAYSSDGLDTTPTAEALADRLMSSLAGSSAPAFEEDEEIAAQAIAKRHATIEQIVEKLRSFSTAADQLRYYVAARSVLGGDKWFHAHAALAMHETDAALGLRLLTDLAEAFPTDAPLLRIVGRIAAGWGEPALARLLFERALALAPRETQTWRELLLLAASEGDAKASAELRRRYEAAERDERFDQVETWIEEDRAGKPSALRVDAMWDTNYADVDLHVIEPGGEEVSYQHTASAAGGLLHGDVTTGFGPEIYTIPSARGEYEIELDYYAADATAVGAETLVHVVTWEGGVRRDHVIVLAGEKSRVRVTALRGSL